MFEFTIQDIFKVTSESNALAVCPEQQQNDMKFGEGKFTSDCYGSSRCFLYSSSSDVRLLVPFFTSNSIFFVVVSSFLSLKSVAFRYKICFILAQILMRQQKKVNFVIVVQAFCLYEF